MRSHICELAEFVIHSAEFLRPLLDAPLQFGVEPPDIFFGPQPLLNLLPQFLIPAQQLARMALQLRTLPAEIDEHRYLRPEHLWHNRLRKIIDRAHMIAAKQMFFAFQCGKKDDWGVSRSLPVPDHGRRFETVHVGHSYIEQNHREIIIQAGS